MPTGSTSATAARSGHRLDHCFGTLDRDSDDIARVTLDDPASGDGVTLWVDAAYPY